MEYNAVEKTLSLQLEKKWGVLNGTNIVVPLDEELLPITDSIPDLRVGNSENNMANLNYAERWIYGIKVGLGTPMVNGTLMVQSDIRKTYVYSKTCQTCQDCSSCTQKAAFYDPAKSSSKIPSTWPNQEAKWYSYHLYSTQIFDKTCIYVNNEQEKICQDNQTLELVDKHTDKYENLVYPVYSCVDGYFGLGREEITQNTTGFIARSVQAGYISKYLYSYMPSINTNTAHLLLGSYDITKVVDGTLWWFDVPNIKQWNSTVQTFEFNDVGMWDPTRHSYISAMFTTGYKYIGVPPDVWDSVVGQIQQMNPGAQIGTFKSQNQRPRSSGQCSEFNLDGYLRIQFNSDAVFSIPIESMVSQEGTKCFWGITHIGNGTEFIIGEVFFQNFYTIFDQEASQMGFGTTKDSPFNPYIKKWSTTPGAPDAPTTTYISSLDNIEIDWTYPDDDGEADVTGYYVEIKSAGGNWYKETTHCDAANDSAIAQSMTCTIPASVLRTSPFALQQGGSVFAQVAAINENGEGPYSTTGSGATMPYQAGAPTNLKRDDYKTSKTQLTFTWSAPSSDGGTPILDFTIYVNIPGSSSTYTIAAQNVNSLTYTYNKQITAGSTYKFMVGARNAVGLSNNSVSLSIIAATTSGKPTNLSQQGGAGKGHQVDFSWIAPADNGGSQVIDYLIQWDQGTGSWVQCASAVTGLSYSKTGLTNGSKYNFKVQARNSVGYGSFSDPLAATAAEPPGSPQNVVRDDSLTTQTTAAIIWQAPAQDGGSPIIDYKVQWDQGTGVWKDAVTGLTTRYWSQNNLQSGKTYNFKVYARNSFGTSAASAQIAVVCATKPVAVSGFARDSTTSANQIVFTWAAPNNGGSSILDYSIKWDQGTGSWVVLSSNYSPTNLKYTKTGLTKGVTYSFQISARNSIGQGDYSSSYQIIADQVPGIPQNVVRDDSNTSKTQVAITWEVPPDDGGSPILDYTVQWDKGLGKGVYYVLASDVSAMNLQYIQATGVTTGVSYSFQVQARNKEGSGPFSSATKVVAIAYPGAPYDFVRDDSQTWDSQVAFSWAEPDDGGNNIHDYTIEWDQGTGVWQLCDTGYLYTHYLKTIGIDPGVTYKFQVKARNDLGFGPLSDKFEIIAAHVPDPPTNLLRDDPNTDTTKVAFTWSGPLRDYGASILDYTIEWDEGFAGGTFVECASGITQTSYIKTGVSKSLTYNFKVAARNVIGQGDWSSSFQIVADTVPSYPTNLTRDNVNTSQNQVAFTWFLPSSDGGETIIDYNIQWDQGLSNGKFVTIATGIKTLSFIRSQGISSGKTYTFMVQARNSHGAGPWSSAFAVIAATVSDSPSGLARINESTNDHQITFTWQAPTQSGGVQVIDYNIYWDQGIQTSQQQRMLATQYVLLAQNVQGTSYTQGSLTVGQTYNYQISANNAIGESALSQSISIISASVPGVPQDIVRDDLNTDENSIGFFWAAPDSDGGSQVLDYTIYWDQGNGDSKFVQIKTGVQDESFVQYDGITSGSAYSIKLAARNVIGLGPFSDVFQIISASVPSCPDDITRIDQLTNKNQVTFAYTLPESDGGSPVIDFLIEWYSGGSWVTVATGYTNTQFTWNQVTTGVTQYFKVYARNVNGYGPSTAEFSIIPATEPTTPNSLQEDGANTNESKITFTWAAPTDNGGLPVLDYTVWWNQGPNFFDPLVTEVATTTYTLTNVVPGKTYKFKVGARNSIGSGPLTEYVQIIAAEAPSVPGQPQLSYDGSQDTVTIIWSPPSDTGGVEIIGYDVTITGSDGVTHNEPNYCDAQHNKTIIQSCKCTIPASYLRDFPFYLPLAALVRSYVSAINSLGESTFSTVGKTYLPTVPDQPWGIYRDDEGTNTTQVQFTWDHPQDNGGAQIIDYSIYWDEGNYGGDFTLISSGVTETTWTQKTGLQAGYQYNFEVVARNAAGTGDFSDAFLIQAATYPGQPTNLQQDRSIQDATQITLTWDEPQDNGGAPVFDYSVSWDEGNGSEEYVLCDFGVDDTSYTMTGLTMGHTYKFMVHAQNEIGFGVWSDPIAIIAATVPNEPLLLERDSENTNKTNVALTWSHPNSNGGLPVIDYTIMWDKGAGGVFYTIAERIQDKQFSTPVDTVGATYTFVVIARNDYGLGAQSIQLQIIAGLVPTVPTNLLQDTTIEDATQITLTWDLPLDNGGSPVIDYSVSWDEGKGDGQFYLCDFGVLTNSYTKTGLTQGQQYYFKVHAKNAIGYGNWTEPFALIASTLPGAPVLLQIDSSHTGRTSVGFTWSVPLTNGGSPVIDYTILWDQGSGSGSFDVLVEETQGTQLAVAAICGKTYSFVVKARNGFGLGPQSSVLQIIAAVTPSVPLSLSRDGSNMDWSQITLTWQPPTDNGCADVLDYSVSWDQGDDGTWIFADDSVASTSLNLTGLILSESYSFMVRARNIIGSGKWSSSVSIIAATVPNMPSLFSEDTDNTNKNQVAFKWSEPDFNGGLPVIDYSIYWDQGEGLGQYVLLTAGYKNENYILTNVITGITYSFSLFARNEYGMSQGTNALEIIAGETPGVPMNIQRNSATSTATSISLIWSAPTDDGGVAVIDYSVQWDQGNGDWILADKEVKNLTYSFIGLQNGQQYSFRVQARNKVGFGSWATTEIICATVPNAPTQLYIVQEDTNRNQVAFTWSASLFDGGLPITQYSVYWDAGKGDGSYVQLGANSLQTSQIVMNLTTGLAYHFKVTAENAYGLSAFTDVLEIIPCVVPGVPINFARDEPNTSMTQVGFTWQSPLDNGGSPVIDYEVQWDQGNGTWVIDTNSTQASYVKKGLTTAQTYQFMVKARNPAGFGVWSAQWSQIAATFPDAPINLQQDNQNTNETQISFLWNTPNSNGGLPIIDYIVEWDQGNHTWTTLKNQTEMHVLRIDDIKPSEIYLVKVKAQNQIGSGVSTPVLAIMATSVPIEGDIHPYVLAGAAVGATAVVVLVVVLVAKSAVGGAAAGAAAGAASSAAAGPKTAWTFNSQYQNNFQSRVSLNQVTRSTMNVDFMRIND